MSTTRTFRDVASSLLLSVALLATGCSDDDTKGGGGDTPTPTPQMTDEPDPTSDATPDVSDMPDPTPEPNPTPPPIPTPGPRPTPVPVELGSINVGTVDLDAMGVATGITFTLPDDVTTFTVVLSGPPAGTYVVQRLEGPTGVLVDDEVTGNVNPIEQLFLGPWAAQFLSPNRVIQDLVSAAAIFPNNPGVSVAGGEYTMNVQGIEIVGQQGRPISGEVNVEIFFKQGAIAQPTGIIDVHLHFTGAADTTAATAPQSALFQGALERMREIYRQAHIEIGEVTYHDVDESYRTIRSLDGPGNDLSELFKNSEGKGEGLHFFFVDRFDIQSPLPVMIGGVSGGLPGPPLRDGDPNSGVAVATQMTENDPAVLAHVMAHEGGHWLGLFHTWEAFTGSVDQMPDTPEGQAGDTHLMFPAVGGGQRISNGQSAVLRHHIETKNDFEEGQ